MDPNLNILLDTVRVDIDIIDLFDFAEASRRNWLEGNQLYKNNHVIIAGVTKANGEKLEIFCSCLRGSNPSDPPREVKMVTSSAFKNWVIHCSCPAGNFKCKHQFACLLYIHNKKDLEVLSSTDVQQRWGKIAKNKVENLYEPVPLSKLCGMREPKDRSGSLTTEISDKIMDLFLTKLPNSALTKSYHGRNVLQHSSNLLREQNENKDAHAMTLPKQATLTPTLPHWNPCCSPPAEIILDGQEEGYIRSYLESLFYKPNVTGKWKYYFGPLSSANQHTFYEAKVCVSGSESISLCVQTFGQSNDTWRRERKIRITASECYELYTYYKNDDGNRDWNKKISSIIHPLEKRLPSLQYGKETEKKALSCYKLKKPGKLIVRLGLVVPPTAPFLGCSPDAFVIDDKILVEIKCPVAGKDKSTEDMTCQLKYVETQGSGQLVLKKKHPYYGQVQLSMCILKANSTDFVIYNSREDEAVIIKVPYDKTFVSDLFLTLREIYFNIFLPLLSTE